MDTPIHNQAAKAAGALSLSFAGLTISDWAALAALVYSVLLIGEWLWKRVFKAVAIRRGWVTPRPAAPDTQTDE